MNKSKNQIALEVIFLKILNFTPFSLFIILQMINVKKLDE